MNRLPGSVPVEANTRKGFHTCVTCSTVIRSTYGSEALELFCYQVTKWMDAFAATLGGFAMLVLAGVIGVRSPSPRPDLRGLGFHGNDSRQRDSTNEGVISALANQAVILVLPTVPRQRSRTLGAAYSSLAEKRGSDL